MIIKSVFSLMQLFLPLRKGALELSEIMKKFDIEWIADARSQEIYNVGEDMLGQLVKNGLKGITVGLETGSEHVVNIMKKGKDHLFKFKKIC